MLGVPVQGRVQASGDASSGRVYRWKTDRLDGRADMRRASGSSQMDTVIQGYLAQAKAGCKGDFAADTSPVKAAGVERSQAYEIACVNQKTPVAASVLFTYGHGLVSTVVHEGRPEDMDLAIDARGRVAAQIR